MGGPEVVLDVGCVNPECDHFGTKGLGNVVIRRRYGASRIRLLRCRHCQREFSERNGTPLYNLRISRKKIVNAVSHLAEGTGVRKTARLTGVSRDTVGRILKRVGGQYIIRRTLQWICPPLQRQEAKEDVFIFKAS